LSLGNLTVEEILRRATPDQIAQAHARAQGNPDPPDDNAVAAGILANDERLNQIHPAGVAALRNRIITLLGSGGVTAGEALQQALRNASPEESPRDKELLRNVRAYVAQRPTSRGNPAPNPKAAGVTWETDPDSDSIAGTDANVARMGGLKDQISAHVSPYLHEFSAPLQQKAWHSPKVASIIPIVAHIRGDHGVSLGIFRAKLLQFIRDPSNYVISSDILRQRVSLLVRYAAGSWQKLHKWAMGLNQDQDPQAWPLPYSLIEDCKELLIEMTAVYCVFDEHIRDNSQTLGWYIHVLSILPGRYAQSQAKDYGRAKDGALAVMSLLRKRHDLGDQLLGYAGYDLPNPEGGSPSAVAAQPQAVPRATPPPARLPTAPSPFARPQGGAAQAVRVSGPTDFPYSGAPYRRARLTPDMCSNCYAPGNRHRARDCPQRCDRVGCRKPNGDAADHSRRSCPNAN